MSEKKSRRALIDSDETNGLENMPPDQIQPPPKQTEAPTEVTPLSISVSEAPPSRKRTPKKRRGSKPEDIEKYCYEVTREMNELYEKDVQLNAEGKPGHHKMDKVDDICAKIIRKETQEAFIKMGILKRLKVWLEPLPDQSLPNQKVKKAILDLLAQLRVSKIDLLESGVGKIVHFYSKNSREAVDVRKTARAIVKKWKAMIVREEVC